LSRVIEIYRCAHCSSGSLHRDCTHSASLPHMNSAHIETRVMVSACSGAILSKHEQLHAILS